MDTNIYEVTPGESVEWTFNVSGMDEGENVVTASLEIRSRLGQIVIPTKSITNTASLSGQITVNDSNTSLLFKVQSNETIALGKQDAFYLFNVSLETSLGRKQFVVPMGRVFPLQTSAEVLPTKLSSGRTALRMVAAVRATKS